MKQKKGLIILLAVLLVLCIVYFALRSYNQSQKEAEQAKAEAEKIQVVDIEIRWRSPTLPKTEAAYLL